MAVVKASSRRSRRVLNLLSWPNTIPDDRGGRGSRIQKPATPSNYHFTNHRTYHAKPMSKPSRKPGRGSSKRAFRSSHGVKRPASHAAHRAPVDRTLPEVGSCQKANTAKQTCNETKDDAEDSFDLALEKYRKAYEGRLLDLRKWVNQKHAERRIDFAVKKELNAYFGKRKFGDRPSAKILSKHACQALELSEHDKGTDLAWAKTQTWLFGERWGVMFERMIRGAMGKSDYGVCGPGYVGEEDVESFACRSEYWTRDEEVGFEGRVDGKAESMEGVEVEPSVSGGGNNALDCEDGNALEADEARGLGLLDGMGNVYVDEKCDELEEFDFEVDVDV